MYTIRALWLLLSCLGVGVGVWAATTRVSDLLAKCDAGVTLHGVKPGAVCADSLVVAYGIGPPAQIALLLAGPAAIACLAMRVRVSMLTALAYVAVGCFGVARWSTHLIVLVPSGFGFAFAALIIGLLQIGVHAESGKDR